MEAFFFLFVVIVVVVKSKSLAFNEVFFPFFFFCDAKNLGNFGPLKCREFYALDHLQKQAQILEKLVELAKAGADVDLNAGELLKNGL